VSKTQQLPVLPLSDVVVLPGMVVPVALDDAERQAVIDAAKAGGDDSVLLVPRLDGEYAPVGVVATIEQLGKLPGGESAAVLRAMTRARVGSGVTGPGSALWVEAEILDEVLGGESVVSSRVSTRTSSSRFCSSGAPGRSSTPSSASRSPAS